MLIIESNSKNISLVEKIRRNINMDILNLLDFTERSQLRDWLKGNHNQAKFCWVVTSRTKHTFYKSIPYIEVVEEALCFGWIDSTVKKMPDGRLAQRLSPRRKGSHWTELNKERCMSLEDRGLMTDAGRQALEQACPYEIVSKGSNVEERIKTYNVELRPELYK